MCSVVLFFWFVSADDGDLVDEAANDSVHEKFTEEDFDEELGSPTEVLGVYCI